jgi:hypothetical protein
MTTIDDPVLLNVALRARCGISAGQRSEVVVQIQCRDPPTAAQSESLTNTFASVCTSAEIRESRADTRWVWNWGR